ncbi:DUF1501 domain-containing protein [Prosthecobacter sp.]|jgi:hypothetical protein|uniref:DUF1501 domain-containing protein n=1 Tax=Prosthecobacter sp. TaxID=1965333 RepID=UPI0037839B34
MTTPNPILRRDFLHTIGGGFTGLALTHLLAREAAADIPRPRPELNGGVHHRAKVKRVIQLFMNGGVSPMDTWDYKPALTKLDGQKLGSKTKIEGATGMQGALMKSPFEFKQHGQCGKWVSSLFPEQAKLVDEMAFLQAMTGRSNVHGQNAYLLNNGFLLPGFPCMGAWISYALGSLSDNLPGFIVLPDARGLPYNGRGCFSAGFLPAVHQGTVIKADSPQPIADLFASDKFAYATRGADGLALLNQMNRAHTAQHPGDSRLAARVAGYELAAKMQLSAPEAFDVMREPESARKAYCLDSTDKPTADFGKRCLLATRLIERGVRFVQVWSGPEGAVNNWDNHGNIPTQLPPMAASIDKPIAALLRDLRQRGLAEDTLVVWTTEFGRTPFSQGSLGRDHNCGSFVSWLWGAGIKPGITHGVSDDIGYQAAQDITSGYDMHATILHLLGIDHEKLTVRTNGVDRRLTDVHGHVVKQILA